MLVVEFYINEKFLGYLRGDSVYDATKNFNEAEIFDDFDKLKERVKNVINVSDTSDFVFDYYAVEYELKEKRRYKPKSCSCFNEEFILI